MTIATAMLTATLLTIGIALTYGALWVLIRIGTQGGDR